MQMINQSTKKFWGELNHFTSWIIIVIMVTWASPMREGTAYLLLHIRAPGQRAGMVTNFCCPKPRGQIFRCAAHFTEVWFLQRVELALWGPGCVSRVGHKFLSGFMVLKGKLSSYLFLLQMPRPVTSRVLPTFPFQSSRIPKVSDCQDSSLVA